jgi:hypothetical protein
LTWSIAFNGSTYGLADFGGATVNGDMAWSDANEVLFFKRTYNTATPPVQTGLAIYGTTDGGTTWNSISFTGITAASSINDITCSWDKYIGGNQFCRWIMEKCRQWGDMGVLRYRSSAFEC